MTAPRKATSRPKLTEPTPLGTFSEILVFEKPTLHKIRFKANRFPADFDTAYLNRTVLAKYAPGVDPESVYLKVTFEVFPA